MLHLSANPNFYDYIHSINLQPNGTCEFVDGAGQCLCLDITGTYKLTYDSDQQTSGSIEFKFENEKCHRHFKVNFKLQQGTFIMRDEIVWNSTMKNWPFSIYTKKFVFDTDPFEGLYQNRENNLYFMLESDKEIKEDMKYFYTSDSIARKTMETLNQNELTKVKELEPELYDAFIKNPNMRAAEFYNEISKSDISII